MSGGGSAEAGWRVELTSGAVRSLRGLSRSERRSVARRIDDLAERGLPPAAVRRTEGTSGVVALATPGVTLHCQADEGRRTIWIVAVVEADDTAAAVVPRSLLETAARRVREWTGGEGMDSWIGEVRIAARSLRRAPGFSAVAVVTLALGIGATAAIFSVARGVVLAPLPYGEPDEVVTVWSSWDNFPDKTWMSIPEFQLFHQDNRSFEDMALYGGRTVSFTSPEAPEQVRGAAVTPNLFAVLGVAPVAGRAFTWDEAEAGTPVVMLAHETWLRRYGGDASVVGRDVELDGVLATVVGVLPEGFRLPVDFGASSRSEVFMPLFVDLESPAPSLDSDGSHGHFGVARLREGITVGQAGTDLERIMAGVPEVGLYVPERRFAPRVYAAKDDVLGSARTTIFVLFGAVGFVLLIACGNVANLLLARAEARAREVAVRTAVGAGRARILRQLLTEGLLLAGVAGALGVGLGHLGVEALLAIDPQAVPRAANVRLDGTVVGFAFAVTVSTVLLFGWIPALSVSRAGVSGVLHAGGRGGRGVRSSRLQGTLVAAQMAMAVLLLTGSGLMARTLVSLLAVDPGFGAENVLTVRVSATGTAYPDVESVVAFYERLREEVAAIPGVRSVGAARLLPLASTMGDSFFRPVGYEPGPTESTQGDWQWATPDYVETMGIRLVEGRTFDERDRRDGRAVVMVNEAIARRYWGEESAIGRAVLASGALDTAVVVGVVGNVSHNGLVEEAKTRYYVPHAQVHASRLASMRSMTLTVATDGPPLTYVEAVRGAVRALDPSIPLAQVRSLDDVMSSSVAQSRFATVLLGAFAAIAFALALIGIYGVLAYAVSRRTREIGVRMALGAARGQVVRLVVREGMTMALTGVGVGTVVAWFVTGLMADLLYGVGPQDPATFVSVPLVFGVVALVACWMPAARASRVRPATVLRYE